MIAVLTLCWLLCCLAKPAAAAMSCTLSVNDIAFGAFDVLAGTEIDATGTASLSCTGALPNVTYRFCFNLSSGSDAVGAQRYMAGTTPKLPFDLYSDAAHSHPFGNWITPYLGGGLQQDIPADNAGKISLSNYALIYAGVPSAQQSAAVGSYSEFLATSASNVMTYGLLPTGGTCPTGIFTTTFAFHVTGTVITNCNAGASNALDFGMASVLASAATATGAISVQCTNATPYAVGLDNGTYPSGAQRRMYSAATGHYLNYGLYLDFGLSQPWGPAASAATCTNGSGTCYTGGSGTGLYQSIPVYGRVPQQTTAQAGTYTDVVTLTVMY